MDADFSAAEEANGYSETIPNWSTVQRALAAAAMEGAKLQAAVSHVSTESASEHERLQPVEDWSAAMEAAVTSILLWAQAAQASGPAEGHNPGGPLSHISVSCTRTCLYNWS